MDPAGHDDIGSRIYPPPDRKPEGAQRPSETCHVERLIVAIVAHDRADSLSRLLASLSDAHVPTDVQIDVVISIDGPPRADVGRAARAVSLEFPDDCRVIEHETNLGLKNHVLMCGQMIDGYDGLVMLEDDLLIAPHALLSAVAMLRAYGNAPAVSQIALYSPGRNEAARLPFLPLDDGEDIYLAMTPCSGGQAWSIAQWLRFSEFLSMEDAADTRLPPAIARWPSETSWKKHLYRYFCATGTYAVYPRVALSTNTGARGTHFAKDDASLHVPLSFGDRLGRRPLPDVSKLVRYDEFGEIEYASLRRLNPDLPDDEVVVDLTGSRPLPEHGDALVLTTRPTDSSRLSFGGDLLPLESNVVMGRAGDEISLSHRSAIRGEHPADPWLAALRAPTRFAVSMLQPPDRWLRHLPLWQVAIAVVRSVAWRARERWRSAFRLRQ